MAAIAAAASLKVRLEPAGLGCALVRMTAANLDGLGVGGIAERRAAGAVFRGVFFCVKFFSVLGIMLGRFFSVLEPLFLFSVGFSLFSVYVL